MAKNKKQKILYIDMDNVLVDFKSGIDQLDIPTKIKYFGRYDEVPGIFAKMNPLKDAVESFNELGSISIHTFYQLLPGKITQLHQIN